MRQQRVLDTLWNQTIFYREVPLTRYEVYTLMTAQGHHPAVIPYFVWKPEPARPEQLWDWRGVSLESRLALARG